MYLKKIDEFLGSICARILPCPKQIGGATSSVSQLLLIRPGGIGDAILLTPTLRLLRDVFPESTIEVLAETRNAGAFSLCPELDQVFCYDKARDMASVLRRHYDVIIDTEQWHRLSAIVARIIRSPVKIGFGTNERRRMFTHPVDYSHERYELSSFFDLLGPLEIESPVAITPPFLTVPSAEQKSADSKLKTFLNKPFVVLFPGASIRERCWGAERFHQLAIRFFDAGFPVIVVGGKEDIVASEIILAGTAGLNLAGKTSLAETAGVLSRSTLLVSGDSGVLHLGVGLGVSTVSLFGPGIANKWAPMGEAHTVINHMLPCSPCTRFGTTPPCPIGAKCIQDISVDEVFVAAQRLLNLQQQKVVTDAV